MKILLAPFKLVYYISKNIIIVLFNDNSKKKSNVNLNKINPNFEFGESKDFRMHSEGADDNFKEFEEYHKNEKKKNDSIIKGQAFEEFIISKFKNQKYYILKEWRGDKFYDGIFAESNLFPDLEYEVTKYQISKRFAIECKWRKSILNNSIELFKQSQLVNYRKYKIEKSIPVYIVFGLGGEAFDPDELFLIPLEKINTTSLSREFLEQFKVIKSTGFKLNHQFDTLYPTTIIPR